MKKIILTYCIFIPAIVFLFASNAESQQVLHGHVPAIIAKRGLHPISRLDSSKYLKVTIGLPLRNQEALSSLLRDLYDPTSLKYHQYLTPEQFTAQFGPTEQDYQTVITFAQAQGLTVAKTHSSRKLLDVSGTVKSIEKAFHVNMLVYQHPTEARTFYAPDANPSPGLETHILHIDGLDSYTGHPLTHLKGIKNVRPNVGSGPNGSGYMGKDFRAAYAPGVTLYHLRITLLKQINLS